MYLKFGVHVGLLYDVFEKIGGFVMEIENGMNQQIILKQRPSGTPNTDTFEWTKTPISAVQEGQLLVKTLYLSVDPYMRGRMSDRKSYVPSYELGKPIEGGVVGEVLESQSPDFHKGDFVLGGYGWQTYATVSAKTVRRIDPTLAPLSTALGILGMTGLTAYFGLLDIGRPQAGETVVISGAAGAVGMVVGQIAKIKGAHVVGIAGSTKKIDYLINELGFDSAISYKGDIPLHKALATACPHGVDVYFDNVGGEISDAVLRRLNKGARVPLCGQISSYNLEKPDIGVRPQTFLLINSALMQGFIVSDFAKRFPEGIKELAQWVNSKQLKSQETIIDGFDQTVNAFLGLFTGDNLGKQLVKVADPSHG